MIKNYLLTAARSLRKNPGFTFINIFGLALGMAAFLFIVHYVRYEHSYEDFHTKGDDIHRITLDIYNGSEYVVTDCETHAGMGPMLKREMPEVLDFVRMYSLDGTNELKIDTKKVFAEKLFYTDPSVFNVFTIDLLHGDKEKVLIEPNKAVISASMARNVFGKENAIGQTFEVERTLFQVEGIMKDLPPNTHLKINVMLSHSTLPKVRDSYGDDNWSGNNEYTYLLLAPGTDLQSLNKKLVDKSIALKPNIGEARYVAEPIKTIHLHSNKTYEPEPNGNAKVVYFLTIIAGFIIIIAWMNYINLSTARAVERAREVGIRKVLGSLRIQLILQFLSESVVINCVAAILAAILFEAGLPLFQQLVGEPLNLHFLTDKAYWYIFGGMLLVGTLSSGIYPAFVLSSFKPAFVLKGKFYSSSHGQLLRKGLVIFQFGVTVILIIGVSTVYLQLDHLLSVDLGMNVEQTVAVRAPASEGPDSTYLQSMGKFKSDLLTDPQIISAAHSGSLPGLPYNELSSTMFTRTGADENAGKFEYYYHSVDADFFETMNISFVAGRNFENGKSNDDRIVINETAANRLGFNSAQDAVGQKVDFYTRWKGEPSTIIGVVRNYYQRSPKENFIPMVYPYSEWPGFIIVKTNTKDVKSAVASIKRAFSVNCPNSAFDYFFIDEMYNQQYVTESRFGKVIITFSVFAVFIACLGLFGLSSYTISQRTKEIGIRKVLGASVSQIVGLLSGNFIRVVLLASLLATPVAWWAMREWLSNYPVRIDLNVWIFILPIVVIVGMALLTVSLQTVRSAMANPVDSLKQE
jgi:putative ABC transport system permease protein